MAKQERPYHRPPEKFDELLRRRLLLKIDVSKKNIVESNPVYIKKEKDV